MQAGVLGLLVAHIKRSFAEKKLARLIDVAHTYLLPVRPHAAFYLTFISPAICRRTFAFAHGCLPASHVERQRLIFAWYVHVHHSRFTREQRQLVAAGSIHSQPDSNDSLLSLRLQSH